MSIPKFNPRMLVLLVIMIVVAALRVATSFSTTISPIAVFTPIGAMALFGGAYFKGTIKPLAFPLLTLFIGDLILSFTVFAQFRNGLLYIGWYWTYAAFALMAIAGKLIIKDVTIPRTAIAVITATLIHWLVSDIGICAEGVDKITMALYLQKLADAIPYELRFLSGTAIYGTLMFGTFEWMRKRYPSLAL